MGDGLSPISLSSSLPSFLNFRGTRRSRLAVSPSSGRLTGYRPTAAMGAAAGVLTTADAAAQSLRDRFFGDGEEFIDIASAGNGGGGAGPGGGGAGSLRHI